MASSPSKFEKCDCTDDFFCSLYNLAVSQRQHQFLKGTSGLTREREELYVAGLLGQEPERPKGPGMLRMARNFFASAIDHVANALREVPEKEYEARLAICKGPCSMWNGDQDSPRCLHEACGCFLKEKAKWESATCPLGKWALPVVQQERGGGCGCKP